MEVLKAHLQGAEQHIARQEETLESLRRQLECLTTELQKKRSLSLERSEKRQKDKKRRSVRNRVRHFFCLRSKNKEREKEQPVSISKINKSISV